MYPVISHDPGERVKPTLERGRPGAGFTLTHDAGGSADPRDPNRLLVASGVVTDRSGHRGRCPSSSFVVFVAFCEKPQDPPATLSIALRSLGLRIFVYVHARTQNRGVSKFLDRVK